MTENTAPAPPHFENLVIKGRWKIMKLIGKGAFGQVYIAVDITNAEHVAMKIESPLAKKPVLRLELSVLRKVQDSPYFARFLGCGRFMPPVEPYETPVEESAHSYLVMELLGPSLAELRKKTPDGRLPLKMVATLGKQMVRSLEFLHDKGILHRDIKPANFCLARGMTGSEEKLRCYLIDFGLSRRFMCADGSIREERQSVGFRGTARYASIAAHFGKDLGRVDDLWSLLYMIVEFLTGSLPWKGKNKEVIGKLKSEMTTPFLFSGIPSHFLRMYNHLQSLRYADKPNYDLLENVFESVLDELTLEASVPASKSMEDNTMSLDKTSQSQEDDTGPGHLTSPQFDKITKMVPFEHKESTTLIEPFDPVSVHKPKKMDVSETLLVPRPPDMPPSQSTRTKRYFLRSKCS